MRLLIKGVDKTHPDPDKDRIGCMKAGDVCNVFPDGHVFPQGIGPPGWEIVDLPGDAEDFRHLEQPEEVIARYDLPHELIEHDPLILLVGVIKRSHNVYRKRAWRWNGTNLEYKRNARG